MNNLVEIDEATYLGEGDGCYTAPYNPPGTPGARDAAWPERTGVEICGVEAQTPATKYYSVESLYQGRSLGIETRNGTPEQVETGWNMLVALRAHDGSNFNVNGQQYRASDLDFRMYENGQMIHTTEQQKAAPTPAPAPVAPAQPAERPTGRQTDFPTASTGVPSSLMLIGIVAALGAVVGGVYLAYEYMVK